MNLTDFRSHFPEFSNTTTYPDGMLTFWSGIAEKQINADRWADLYGHGVELATAHYLSMAEKTQTNSNGGGGVVSSKSVGDVSVSYDASSITEKDAGHWNTTAYGRQFIHLARICGMGGKQI